jgi:flagellum-specific ATP synthase
MARSVVVVATSDEAPLMRRQSAYMTMSIAEYFRDQGKNVMCMMDSVTRFAMAQREIGLSAGEPPTTKGYPPTTFAELPRLLERAGPGIGDGNITGLFTVLVDGDDHNEPIADAVRGILDGHIVLSRTLAEKGHFPAIDVLQSISRLAPDVTDPPHQAMASLVREALGTYRDAADLIQVGAYVAGSDPRVDAALSLVPKINTFLRQGLAEQTPFGQVKARLQALVSGSSGGSHAPRA